jgi:hypothetical protein
MSDIEDLEEQTCFRVNKLSRGGKFGWASTNIQRASVQREKKAIVVPQPADIEPAPPAALEFQGADVVCYSQLIERLKDRVGQLEVRYLDFDKLAGFAEGLSGKVFGAAQVKRLAVDKLFDAIRAAGLRLRIEEDPEQTQKMQARIADNFNPRQATQARPGYRYFSNKMIDGVLNHLANKKGGLTRLNLAVKQARSNSARRAWERKRENPGLAALMSAGEQKP